MSSRNDSSDDGGDEERQPVVEPVADVGPGRRLAADVGARRVPSSTDGSTSRGAARWWRRGLVLRARWSGRRAASPRRPRGDLGRRDGGDARVGRDRRAQRLDDARVRGDVDGDHQRAVGCRARSPRRRGRRRGARCGSRAGCPRRGCPGAGRAPARRAPAAGRCRRRRRRTACRDTWRAPARPARCRAASGPAPPAADPRAGEAEERRAAA